MILFEILIARSLGAAAFGVFATAKACAVLAAFFMEFGTPMLSIQEGSRQPDRLPALLGSSLAVSLAAFAGLYLLLVVVTGSMAPNPVLGLLLIVLPYGLMLSVQSALGAVYSSYQTMHVNAFYQALSPVAILALYFLYVADAPTLTDVGFVLVAGIGIVTGIWLVHTLRRVRPQFSLQKIRETLRSSYQYGITGVLGQIYFRTDIVMLSILAGLHEAGIYAAAFKLVELVQKVAVLAGRVFAPALFKASHESTDTFRLFASMMTRLMAVFGLIVGVICFVLADDLILLLFGDTYASSVPVLRILGGVMAAKCISQILQLLMSSIDLHFRRNAGLGTTVVVHIGANAVLIPLFGAQGAAYATLFSSVLIVILYAYLSSGKGHFHYIQWLLVPTLLAAMVVGVTYAANLNTYVGAVLALVMFIVSLFATRYVRWNEIRFVCRSVLTIRTQ